MLCGLMFGLRVVRHRLFEIFPWMLGPDHAKHSGLDVVQTGRPVKRGQYMSVVGHFSNIALAREAMGIDWMKREELAQAIPPAYTEWIGRQLIASGL
jgi:DNA (cytosine-5)-methyltransferase 1